jgi:hypothetical protein
MLILGALALMGLALVACGGAQPSPGSGSPETTPTASYGY